MNNGLQHLAQLIKQATRSVDDLEYIRSFLMKIPFFQSLLSNFHTELIYDFCNRIKFIEICAQTIIIKQGAKAAQELFILVQGSVHVMIKDVPYNKNENPVKGLYFLENLELAESHIQPKDDKQFWDAVKSLYGLIKASINASGALLGEKALLESKARAATIITSQASQFLVIRKEDFDIVKGTYQEQELNKRKILRMAFPLIFDTAKYTRLYKEKIHRLFFDLKVSRDQTILHPHQQITDMVYIIAQGDFSVEHFQIHDESASYPLRAQQIKGQYKQICLLYAGSTLGEEMHYDKKYQFRIRCLSSCGLLLMFHLSELLKHFNDDSLPILLQEYLKKKYALDEFLACTRNVSLFTKIVVPREKSHDRLRDYLNAQLRLKKKILSINEMKSVKQTIEQKPSQRTIKPRTGRSMRQNFFFYKDLHDDQMSKTMVVTNKTTSRLRSNSISHRNLNQMLNSSVELKRKPNSAYISTQRQPNSLTAIFSLWTNKVQLTQSYLMSNQRPGTSLGFHRDSSETTTERATRCFSPSPVSVIHVIM